MEFIYIDNDKICVYENGKIQREDSAYITKYKENTKRDQKNREWKKTTDTMMYDGLFVGDNERVVAQISSASLTQEKDKILYTFSVNETSGIYYKYFNDEKKTEAHFLTSNDYVFKDVMVTKNGAIVGTVQKDMLSSDIAVFSKNGGDYKSVTSGDSKDENPFMDTNGEIWFNSYGIGRDVNNEFVKYGLSEILKLNLTRMELDTVLSHSAYSYIKPIVDTNGDLYCICKKGEDVKANNPLLQVLLIPVRLIQAIGGFLSMFVTIFTGKPLVEGKGKTRNGYGAAKHADEKQIFINNHLLNVEQELKKNSKIADSGFIPHGWKLIKIKRAESDFTQSYDMANMEELASGVADYALIDENGEKSIVYTNGKHIFALSLDGEKKKRKLVNTDFCVKLNGTVCTEENSQNEEDDFFDGI